MSLLDNRSVVARLAHTRGRETRPPYAKAQERLLRGGDTNEMLMRPSPLAFQISFESTEDLEARRRKRRATEKPPPLSRRLERLRADALSRPDDSPRTRSRLLEGLRFISEEDPVKKQDQGATRGRSEKKRLRTPEVPTLMGRKRLETLFPKDHERQRSRSRSRQRRSQLLLEQRSSLITRPWIEEESRSPERERVRQSDADRRDQSRMRQKSIYLIDSASKELPLNFLREHGAAGDLDRARLKRGLAIIRRLGLRMQLRFLKRWRKAAMASASHNFFQREVTWAKQRAATSLLNLLKRKSLLIAKRRLRRWRKNARLIKKHERLMLHNAKASVIQRLVRNVQNKKSGAKFFRALRRARRRCLQASAEMNLLTTAHARRGTILMRSRFVAELKYASASRILRSWHSRFLRKTLAHRVEVSRALRYKKAVELFCRYFCGLHAELLRSNKLEEPSLLSQWADRNKPKHQQRRRRFRRKKEKKASKAAEAERRRSSHGSEVSEDDSSFVTTESDTTPQMVIAAITEMKAPPKYTGRVAATMIQAQVRSKPHRRALPGKFARRRFERAASEIMHRIWALKATIRLQRSWRLYQERLLLEDRLLADRTVAEAVAQIAIWELLDLAQRKEAERRFNAIQTIKRGLRRHGRRLEEWRQWASVAIQSGARRRTSCVQVARLRSDKLQYESAIIIAQGWDRFMIRRAMRWRQEARKAALLERRRDLLCLSASAVLRRFAVSWHDFTKVLRLRLACRSKALAALNIAVKRSRLVCLLSKNMRRHRGRVTLRFRLRAQMERREVRTAWFKRQEAARRIALEWRDSQRRWFMPVRVIARRRLALLYAACDVAIEGVRLDDAALLIKRAIRRYLDRASLRRGVASQLKRQEARQFETLRHRSARRIQLCYARRLGMQAQTAHLEALSQRQERNERRALEDESQRVIARTTRTYLLNRLLTKRFASTEKKLKKSAEEARMVEEARQERDTAEDATQAAEDALELVKLGAWRLGSDETGLNYFYNWITGETTYEKPEGWEPQPEELWVKNVDEHGNVYFLNQLTQAAQWLPPCQVCYATEGRKICLGCDDKVYCDPCFDDFHLAKGDDLALVTEEAALRAAHEWRGTDIEKDVLARGEAYCINCEKRKALVVCKVCRDAYCDTCFATVHALGKLASHTTIPYDEAKKGWQEIKGRVDGEQTYYYNAATRESQYEKPEDLMGEEELAEHRLFKKFQGEAGKFCEQVDKLQTDVERLQYEKDTTIFSMQSKAKEEHNELEELRKALMLEMANQPKSTLDRLRNYNPLKSYKDKKNKEREKRRLYRKMLLLNKKAREEAFDNDIPVIEEAVPVAPDSGSKKGKR